MIFWVVRVKVIHGEYLMGLYYSLLFITLKIDFSEDNKSLEIDL